MLNRSIRFAKAALLSAALSLGYGCTCGSADEPHEDIIGTDPAEIDFSSADIDFSDAPVDMDFSDLDGNVPDGTPIMDFSATVDDESMTENEGPEMVFTIDDVIEPAEERDGGRIHVSSIFELTWRAAIAHGGTKYIPLYFGVGRCESQFQPDLISRAGAVGVYQIMPKTLDRVREVFPEAGDVAIFNPTLGKGLGKMLPIVRNRGLGARRRAYAQAFMQKRNSIAERHDIPIHYTTLRGGFPYSYTQLQGLPAKQVTEYIAELIQQDWRMSPYHNPWWSIDMLYHDILDNKRAGYNESAAIALAVDAYNRGPLQVCSLKRRVGRAAPSHSLKRTYVQCVVGAAKAFQELQTKGRLNCEGIMDFAERESKSRGHAIGTTAARNICLPYIVYEPE